MPKGRRADGGFTRDGKTRHLMEYETEILQRETRRVADGRQLFEISRLYEPALKPFCEEVRSDAARSEKLAALMAAVTREENPLRASSLFLQKLAGSLEDGRKAVTDHTIRNFAAGLGALNWLKIFDHLRLAAMLKYYAHPALEELTARVLCRDFDDLERFERIFVTAIDQVRHLDHQSVLLRGARIYQAIEQDGEPLHRSDFAPLRDGPLLRGLEFSTPQTWSPAVFLAVRPSSKAGDVYLTNVNFYLFEDPAGDPRLAKDAGSDERRMFIYTETFIAQEPKPVSTGFVIPQKRGVYIIAHQSKQFGFNFSGFDSSEFDERDQKYFAGVLLAANRGGDTRPMVTRVALTPAFADGACGAMSVDTFVSKMAEEERGDVARQIVDYIHDMPDAELAYRTADGATHYAKDAAKLMQQAAAAGQPVRVKLRKPISAPKPE